MNNDNQPCSAGDSTFSYTDEKFADLQMLRYRVDGFARLTVRQKALAYCLTEAALWGRDILYDQNCRHNIKLRKVLEAIYVTGAGRRDDDGFAALTTYLKRVWFANGVHHHYSTVKFEPAFSEAFLADEYAKLPDSALPLDGGQDRDGLWDELRRIIFDPSYMPKRVNQADGQDLVATSACNYYGDGVTQAEAEAYYAAKRQAAGDHSPEWGLNSTLVRRDGQLAEMVWRAGGRYGEAITHIIGWLNRALEYAESEAQRTVIIKLIEYYLTGDLRTFDQYSIAWVADTASVVDFVNGFIETYGDPLGIKASWEALVDYKDVEATARTETISANAQWFEDHSPVAAEYRKPEVKGVSAKVIDAAILGGDLYPSTAIGINLPNSNWIRAAYGSKSVTIGNITHAYNVASRGSGLLDEFVIDDAELQRIRTYGDVTDELHTDLHECLGHGSGRLMPGVSPDALKAYGATIEEARADLFGLYYIADSKLIELGLITSPEAYKAHYYTYMMNGLMTQLARIAPGAQVEEAHMRNRQLIARWALEHGRADHVVEMVVRDGKTYVKINDYEALRGLFARLLAEVQRIKSTGDYDAARTLVETYGITIDPVLHAEVLERYAGLGIAPYKGFINPRYEAVTDDAGRITDVRVTYGEAYDEQMLRYSRDYAAL